MTYLNLDNDDIEQQVPPSSNILNQKALPVPIKFISNPDTQNIIDKMLKIAHGRQGDAKYPTLVGLAAPQIGILKRIIIVGTDSLGDGKQPTLEAFINPILIYKSTEKVDDREGCFSTGRVCGIVSRSKVIKFQAYTREGKKVTLELKDFPARIMQHEIDHLDGVRFPDIITDDEKLHWVEEDKFGEYRIHWHEWKIKCPREKWLSLKINQN